MKRPDGWTVASFWLFAIVVGLLAATKLTTAPQYEEPWGTLMLFVGYFEATLSLFIVFMAIRMTNFWRTRR